MRRALFALLACTLLACREKDVTVADVPKSPESLSAREALSWTLPPGWREEGGQGMRFATILAGPVGQAYEISVVRIPGEAGGTVANVNRWRAQLSLPEIDAARLARSSERLPSAAGEVLLVDLTGKDETGAPARMLAATLRSEGTSWFFKAVGPKDALGRLLPRFKSLLRSLRRDG